MRVVLITTDDREHFKDYAASKPRFGTAVEALLEGFAEIPEVELHVLSCTQKPISAPEKLTPNIWYHSLLVPKIGWMRSAYQGCIRATRKLLRKLQPDVVHGQGTERDCALSAVFSGFPHVITIHGNMRLIAHVNKAKPLSYLWLAARLERFTLPRAQGVICISKYTQDAVADLAQRTWVVPNAVETSFYDVPRVPGSPPSILCVGHVMPRKNQNALIRALDPLAPSVAFKVVFAGYAEPEAEYAAEFLRLVQERPWCEHLGALDRHQLREQLTSAHALALPSLEENCPMVVLEAMATGVPVVAANVGGVPEIVQDGVSGMLFDPLNAQSIATAISNALSDTSRLAAMASAAKQQALQRFHPVEIARRHTEIYRELTTRTANR